MTSNERAAFGRAKLKTDPFERVAVIGAGAWGTALALTAYRAGRRVRLWAREEAVVRAISQGRPNPFLPTAPIPEGVTVTGDLGRALIGADLAVLVCPSQHLRAMARRAEALLPAAVPVVICCKGLEGGSLKLMSQVVEEAMPGRPLAVLSGPTFAAEVAAGLPTAVTVAAPLDNDRIDGGFLAARIAATLATASFRPYVSDDVTGVEIGGAVKNVIAIACGVAEGLGWGANARAALVTRGLAEMTRLGVALGARADTLGGLAGAGDLMLTCSSEQSRNFTFGKALGSGQRPGVGDDGPVVEGAVNARSVMALAAKLRVEMPICDTVCAVLGGDPVAPAFDDLMTRDLRPEPMHLEDSWSLPHVAAVEREEELLSA